MKVLKCSINSFIINHEILDIIYYDEKYRYIIDEKSHNIKYGLVSYPIYHNMIEYRETTNHKIYTVIMQYHFLKEENYVRN